MHEQHSEQHSEFPRLQVLFVRLQPREREDVLMAAAIERAPNSRVFPNVVKVERKAILSKELSSISLGGRSEVVRRGGKGGVPGAGLWPS